MRYFATSKDTIKEEIKGSDYWLDYNPNINMWRINGRKAVPKELMGYSPHKKALLHDLSKKIK